MRRVINTAPLFWVNLPNKALSSEQNVPLMHLLNVKWLFMSWKWFAFNEVDDLAHSKRLSRLHGIKCTNFRHFYFVLSEESQKSAFNN